VSYSEFQKSHPHWPKRMKDLKGYKVRLLEECHTYSDRTFKPGEVFKVCGVYRGRLHVDAVTLSAAGVSRGIRHLPLRMVELCE